VIGDDDEPSRAGTPRPKEKAEPAGTAPVGGKDKEENGRTTSGEDKAGTSPEIPPEIQARLRKLEKLEPKYSGALHVNASGVSNIY
jgi:hypothetical protein